GYLHTGGRARARARSGLQDECRAGGGASQGLRRRDLRGENGGVRARHHPVPDSSEMTPKNCADVVAAKNESGSLAPATLVAPPLLLFIFQRCAVESA